MKCSCANAEPNYGSLWSFCQIRTQDNPSNILVDALDLVCHEILETQEIYFSSIAYFVYKELTNNQNICFSDSYRVKFLLEDFELVFSEHNNMSRLIYESTNCISISSSGIFFEEDFSSALICYNRCTKAFSLCPSDEKRLQIFSTDQIMP